MRKLLAVVVLLFPFAAFGQLGNVVLRHFPGVPSGSCGRNTQAINDATGDLYTCLSGSWHPAGTTTGTGTVTSFSAGTLSPLFTTGVLNASTTPALSFSLSNATAHTWFGNPTGSTAAPGFNLLTSGDIPDLSATYAIVGRQIITANSLSGGGDLSANRTLQLVNDASAPGATQYYGTDGSGTKGWFSLPSGAVFSVFTRTGAVTAQSGDYTAAQVTNAFDTSGNNNIGAHYFDVQALTAPANPAVSTGRVYFDSGTGLLACLNSAGASCLPSSGGGSVSSVFGRTGAITSQTGDYTFAQIGSTPTTLSGYGITNGVTNTTTVNGKALSTNITLGLASADFANQGTTTTVLHGNAAGNPSFAAVSLANDVTGNLGVAHLSSGTGASSTTYFRGDNSWVQPACASLSDSAGGCSMSTTAGGDLSGTLPNPTVAKINGNSVPSGAAAHQTPVATAASTLAWKTLPDCHGSSNALNYTQSTDVYSCLSIATLSNPMTTLGDMIYGGALGAATQLSGPTAVNGVAQILTSTPSGGVATAPTWAPLGLIPRASTCTSNVDAIVATDRGGSITWSDASACAVSIAAVGSTGFASDFVTGGCNIGTGAVTITPTTSKISYVDGGSYTANAPSVQLLTGQCIRISTDADGTDYDGILRKINPGTVTSVGASFTGGLISVGGSPVTSSGTLGFTVAGTSGGIPFFSNSSTWASSAALPSGDFVLGGGAGSSPTATFSTVPLTKGGTGGTTQATAAAAVLPTPTRAGDVVYWDGSIWNHLAGNNSGTQVLQESAAGVPSWAATGGTGTVTSIATTSPITGGTITSTGTIACATCVVASSPGAGIAHFAGSTQTVTSSAVSLTADVSGLLPAANMGTVSVTISTSSPVTVSTTLSSAFYYNQNATAGTAMTFNLPTAAAGKQFCIANSNNGSAANTGVLTIQTSATGQFIIFTDGTLSATDGNVTSGGAAADAACVVGVDSTHWQLYTQVGTWAKH